MPKAFLSFGELLFLQSSVNNKRIIFKKTFLILWEFYIMYFGYLHFPLLPQLLPNLTSTFLHPLNSVSSIIYYYYYYPLNSICADHILWVWGHLEHGCPRKHFKKLGEMIYADSILIDIRFKRWQWTAKDIPWVPPALTLPPQGQWLSLVCFSSRCLCW